MERLLNFAEVLGNIGIPEYPIPILRLITLIIYIKHQKQFYCCN